MNDLVLISEENIIHIANKSNRKNKNRKFYLWELKRFKEQKKNDFEMDIFPSTSEKRGIQIIKTQILSEINFRNIFDFNYVPIEKDFLSIRNIKDNDEYLNLYFRHGKWEEEYFLYTLRNYKDEYIVIGKGQVEL